MFSLYFILKNHFDEVKVDRKISKLNEKLEKLTVNLQAFICKYYIYITMNLDKHKKKYMFIFINNLLREHENLIRSSKYEIIKKDNVENMLNEVEDLLEVIHAGNKIFLELIKS